MYKLFLLPLLSLTLLGYSQQSIYNDLQLGSTINSATGSQDKSNIFEEFTVKDIDTTLVSQRTELKAYILTSKMDYLKIQNSEASISAKGSYGGFKASGSYSKSVTNTLKKNHFSQYLMLRIKVENYSVNLTSPKLNKRALEYAINNPGDFLDIFGDEYVSKRVFGGEYFVLYEFESKSKTETKKVKETIKAAAEYLNNSGKASSSKSEFIKKFNEVKSTDIMVIKNGGLERISEFDLEKLIDSGRDNFIADVLKNPRLLRVETQPIYAKYFEETKNVDFDKIRVKQKNMLDSLFYAKLYLSEQIENAKYIIDNIDLFEIETIFQLLDLNKRTPNSDYTKVLENYINEATKNITTIDNYLTSSDRKVSVIDNINVHSLYVKQLRPKFKEKIYIKNPYAEKVQLNTDFKSKKDYFLISSPIYTNLGFCDYNYIKSISVRGNFYFNKSSKKTQSNSLSNIYKNNFTTIQFLDENKNIISETTILNGEPIKWIPGTYARIKLELIQLPGFDGTNSYSFYKKNSTIFNNIEAVIM